MFAIVFSRFSIAISRAASSLQFSRNTTLAKATITTAPPPDVPNENMFELCGTVTDKPTEVFSANRYRYTNLSVLHTTGDRRISSEYAFRFVVFNQQAVEQTLTLEKGDFARVRGQLKMQANKHGKHTLEALASEVQRLKTQQQPSDSDVQVDNVSVRSEKQTALKSKPHLEESQNFDNKQEMPLVMKKISPTNRNGSLQKSKPRLLQVAEQQTEDGSVDNGDNDDGEEEVAIVKTIKKKKIREIVQYEDEIDGDEDNNTDASEQKLTVLHRVLQDNVNFKPKQRDV